MINTIIFAIDVVIGIVKCLMADFRMFCVEFSMFLKKFLDM